jgi:acetyltransferase-like isoleucine patch superfamily enzyme
MTAIDSFILRLKRGETPFLRFLRAIAKAIFRPPAPRVPNVLKPVFRSLYEFHFAVIVLARSFLTVFYRLPLLQSRCKTFGKNISIDGMPFISGHVEIHLGDNVWLGGKLTILSGRVCDNPRFVMGNHAELGWNVVISVNKEIIIEDNARVSYDCRISDNDGHPRQADLRAANLPPKLRDIRPVRICRNAWIGNGTHIMKGVTIGEGAIIGANSVVISDIPPYALALGNPAEVYFRNYGKPTSVGGAAAQKAETPATSH